MAKILQKTEVKEYDSIREYLKRRTTFFGLLGWLEVVRVDRINTSLMVTWDESRGEPDVYINGVKYVKE